MADIVAITSTTIMEFFDSTVSDLSQMDYRDVLEEVITDLEFRLDAVKSEIEAEEGYL